MAIHPKKVKHSPRNRRRMRVRKSLRGQSTRPRLTVFRSGRHTYAQIISYSDGGTIISASTREAEVLGKVGTLGEEGFINAAKSSKSSRAAKAVGLILASRAREKNITKVVFDRGAHPYHGRVKAVADGAREGGLDF